MVQKTDGLKITTIYSSLCAKACSLNCILFLILMIQAPYFPLPKVTNVDIFGTYLLCLFQDGIISSLIC